MVHYHNRLILFYRRKKVDKKKPFGIRLGEKTHRSLIELAYLHNSTKGEIVRIFVEKTLENRSAVVNRLLEESLRAKNKQEVSNG
jgi:hypothetical protein